MNVLNNISSPEDIKKLSPEELEALCGELREFIIDNVSATGGHLSPNLGVVELTVAIHRVFDTARDRLVFDVGHQSYIHKILTGRRDSFNTLRQFGGLSGFPKPEESRHDAFIAGHASNSISVALGMARARTLSGKDYNVAALIGDGALTGGLSFEALSDAGDSKEPLVVILNDNGMSIAKNVGGVSRYLSQQRIKPSYISFKKGYKRAMEAIPGGKYIYRFTHGIKSVFKQSLLHCSMFEEMGFQYYGPVDGHDIARLTDVLTWAKEAEKPVLVHVITKKGKGYPFSEKDPDEYHGVPKFDLAKGVETMGGATFSAVFGRKLVKMAGSDPRICAITAAMPSGTGTSEFCRRFPNRFFDVGIAEGHAVSMAAGSAKQGSIPVFAVYSTFLQRSYDMLIHDVAISGLHVVLAVDRAGIVGEDGETHQGVFDTGYLTQIPGMTVFSPSSFAELEDMLERAAFKIPGPVAVRYPRGSEGEYRDGGADNVKIIRKGNDFSVVTYGIMINEAIKAADILEKAGISAEIIKLGAIAPLDIRPVAESVLRTKRLLVLEDSTEAAGVGVRIAAELFKSGIKADRVILKNTGTGFLPHGTIGQLRKMCGIDGKSVADTIIKECKIGKDQA